MAGLRMKTALFDIDALSALHKIRSGGVSDLGSVNHLSRRPITYGHHL